MKVFDIANHKGILPSLNMKTAESRVKFLSELTHNLCQLPSTYKLSKLLIWYAIIKRNNAKLLFWWGVGLIPFRIQYLPAKVLQSFSAFCHIFEVSVTYGFLVLEVKTLIFLTFIAASYWLGGLELPTLACYSVYLLFTHIYLLLNKRS